MLEKKFYHLYLTWQLATANVNTYLSCK